MQSGVVDKDQLIVGLITIKLSLLMSFWNWDLILKQNLQLNKRGEAS